MTSVKNIIITILGLTGIFGNIICIIVLGSILFVIHKAIQKNPLSNILDQRFNWYLLFLAIADLIFSIIVYIQSSITNLYEYSEYFCYSIDFIFESLNLYGIFLNLILSVDRFVAIKRPLEHRTKEFITQKYPKLISLITVGIAVSIISLSLINNIPDYDQNESLKCHTVPNIFNILTIFLIIIILAISISLNIASWCFLCQYNHTTKQNLSETLTLSTKESRLSTQPLIVSPNRSSSNNSSISHSIAQARARSGAAKQKQPNPYHLVLIAVNMFDIPFYFFFICGHFKINFGLKEIEIITNVSQILGHSINVIVYLFFHKRFRVMFSKPFCMIIQSICKENGRETNEFSRTTEKQWVKSISYCQTNANLKQNKPSRMIVI